MTDEHHPHPARSIHFDRDMALLRRRLMREATTAVDMLEAAIRALWQLDADLAREVRRGEDRLDAEEVEIEAECLRLMTLQQPFGADFRFLAFCLKVNTDIERVADHAASIAKITIKLHKGADLPPWPTALTELGERLPLLCHRLLRAVLDQDEQAAVDLVGSDEVIDALDKRLFHEVQDLLARHPDQAEGALLIYRVGRELERVGDLMCNIAEDVVYLATGHIVRHQKPGRADAPRDRGP